IHRAAFVNLGKEQQPQQVQRPWDMSVKVGEQRSVQLPPQTTILDVFDNPTISGKFLILGKPGGGKTTTLLELAEALIERAERDSDAPIPVILELSSWQEVTKRKFLPFGEREKYDPLIKEWVLSQLISKGMSQEIGEQWLREKELVLLLDGLDELQAERQGKCVRAINQFLGSEFSPLHLVVCSRKEEYEVYEEMLQLNGAICLEDLTNEQIQDYFTSVNLGEFWESIKGSEKIVDFIRQPLFLAVTGIAYQQIDVEEWRNCNTEERAIDYLLGVYTVERLTKNTASRWYSSSNIPTQLVMQNALKRLSKSMLKKQEKNFAVQNITLCLLESNLQIEYINHISAFFTFLVIFIPFATLFKPEYYVIISVFLSYLFFTFFWRGKPEDRHLEIVGFSYFLSMILASPIIILLRSEKIYITYTIVSLIVSCVGLYLSHFAFCESDISLPWFSVKMLFDVSETVKKIEPLNYKNTNDLNEIMERDQTEIKLVFWTFICFCFCFILAIYIADDLIQLNNFILSIVAKLLAATIVAIILTLLAVCSLWVFSVFGALAYLILYSILVDIYNFCRRFVLRFILGFSGIMPWNITRFLDYCTDRLILQRVGNRYRFIHRLVQEHFAKLEIQKD
ncbi:MAG: NACHT domain-containing protein, partial [Planktothrix sp.]